METELKTNNQGIDNIYYISHYKGSTKVDLSKIIKIYTSSGSADIFEYLNCILNTGDTLTFNFNSTSGMYQEHYKLLEALNKYRTENKEYNKSKYLEIKKMISEINSLTSKSPKPCSYCGHKTYTNEEFFASIREPTSRENVAVGNYTLDNIYEELINIKNKLEENRK